MKHLIKKFTFKTPELTLGDIAKTYGNITARYFRFKDNGNLYVGFYHINHPLFYMDVDSMMGEFSLMNTNDNFSVYDGIFTLVSIIEPLFVNADEATAILNRYKIKETFERFKEAYEDMVGIYNQLEDQTILNVGYPFEKSFDEIAIAEWCDNATIMNEFAIEIIRMFDLAE